MKKTILLLSIIATIGLASAQVKISKQGINLSKINEPYIDGIDFTQYVDQDTATQNLTLENNSQQTNDLLKLSNASSVLIKDDYEPNTDNQNISVENNTQSVNDLVKLENGGQIMIEDDYEQDTINPNQTIQAFNNTNGNNDKIKLSNGGSILIKDDTGKTIQKWNLTGKYIINSSDKLGLNQTLLNQTIDSRDKFEKDTNISDDQNLSQVLNRGNKANSSINLNQNSIEAINKIYSDNSNTGFFQDGANQSETITGITAAGKLQTSSILISTGELKADSVTKDEISSNSLGYGLIGGSGSKIYFNANNVDANNLSGSSGSPGEVLKTDGSNAEWGNVSASQNLSGVLQNSNSAGQNNIDMNGQSIKSSNGEICIGQYC